MKLAVFDVDGTLVDSRSSIFRAATEAAEATGITPPTYDAVRSIVGISLFEAIVQMLPDHDEATHRAYLTAFQHSFVTMHNTSSFCEVLYDGADDLLRRLKSDGWCLGMATGQSRRGVNRCLDSYAWHDLFDTTFCADDGPSKPHPHMLQANLKALGLDPHQAVMIGDTGHDMRMAREARVHAIGVSWGFHTVEELDLADHIVHDFNELETALNAFR
ncbi:haloacid dehalogenase [Asticcacaulis sp. AC460]|uniref:HAD-IA family hydrolase n=1 Tax=Asticcacaulis sp. AC460 TaxID=1282360 RepID=UPI0003C40BDB|nr:HAD-IA family hydrolase [Asticcacaulis sp. AC460]ESQ88188.1 haloacid dehalogenase [Asticcacaulis sp. AC460]